MPRAARREARAEPPARRREAGAVRLRRAGHPVRPGELERGRTGRVGERRTPLYAGTAAPRRRSRSTSGREAGRATCTFPTASASFSPARLRSSASTNARRIMVITIAWAPSNAASPKSASRRSRPVPAASTATSRRPPPARLVPAPLLGVHPRGQLGPPFRRHGLRRQGRERLHETRRRAAARATPTGGRGSRRATGRSAAVAHPSAPCAPRARRARSRVSESESTRSLWSRIACRSWCDRLVQRGAEVLDERVRHRERLVEPVGCRCRAGVRVRPGRRDDVEQHAPDLTGRRAFEHGLQERANRLVHEEPAVGGPVVARGVGVVAHRRVQAVLSDGGAVSNGTKDGSKRGGERRGRTRPKRASGCFAPPETSAPSSNRNTPRWSTSWMTVPLWSVKRLVSPLSSVVVMNTSVVVGSPG